MLVNSFACFSIPALSVPSKYGIRIGHAASSFSSHVDGDIDAENAPFYHSPQSWQRSLFPRPQSTLHMGVVGNPRTVSISLRNNVALSFNISRLAGLWRACGIRRIDSATMLLYPNVISPSACIGKVGRASPRTRRARRP